MSFLRSAFGGGGGASSATGGSGSLGMGSGGSTAGSSSMAGGSSVDGGSSQKLAKPVVQIPVTDQKMNNQAMIQACKRNDFDQVFRMYERGFRVTSKLSYDYGAHVSRRLDLNLELNRLEAQCMPVYLLAGCKLHVNVGGEGAATAADPPDPMHNAFNQLKKCRELSATLKEHSNKLEQISKMLETFTWRMLELCEGGAQVQVFLSQDDDIDGISMKGSTLVPRVYEALRLDHKSFVTHDSCQEVIARAFYGSDYETSMSRSTMEGILWLFKHVLLFPVYVLAYVVNKYRCQCLSKGNEVDDDNDDDDDDADDEKGESVDYTSSDLLSMNTSSHGSKREHGICRSLVKMALYMDIPRNRMVTQLTTFCLYVLFIMLTLVVDPTATGVNSHLLIDPKVYHWIMAVWTLGYLYGDMSLMYQLTKSVKMKNASFLRLQWAKFVSLFSNASFVYCFLSHFMFLGGIVVQYFGLHHLPLLLFQAGDEDSKEHRESVLRLGLAMEGLGVTMIVSLFLQYFRLDPTTAAVYVAMKKCITILASFVLTFVTITAAMGMGMHFIMRHAESCKKDKAEEHSIYNLNGSFTHELRHLNVYCVDEGLVERVVCPDTCLNSYFASPELKAVWQDECTVGGVLYTPHASSASSRMLMSRRGGGSHQRTDDDFDGAKNMFLTISSTMSTMFWNAFDPGHPEYLGCAIGFTRYSALFLWATFNTINLVILMNLLIAMMNVAMSILEEDQGSSWKYFRTQVWVDYFNKQVVLPAPMNLILIVLDSVTFLFFLPCRVCCPEVLTEDDDHLRRAATRTIYLDLVQKLSGRYMDEYADMPVLDEAPAEGETIEEQIEKLGTNIQKMYEKSQSGAKRELESLNEAVMDMSEMIKEVRDAQEEILKEEKVIEQKEEQKKKKFF